MSAAKQLPRILMLHGGGTNATIFKAQCRTLEPRLKDHYRLVYAEAPIPSNAGPDVLTVYADYGPFKRWLRWLDTHDELEDKAALEAIDGSLQQAMEADDRIGGRGPWVGLLGFSQGAKIAASLLFRRQVQEGLEQQASASSPASTPPGRGAAPDKAHWKFAVLMAGRGPIVNLMDKDFFSSSLLASPSQIGLPAGQLTDLTEQAKGRHILRLPTIHVHGLADEGLEYHRELQTMYCDWKSVTLLEWEGNHRVAFKPSDVQPIVDNIIRVGKEVGVGQA